MENFYNNYYIDADNDKEDTETKIVINNIDKIKSKILKENNPGQNGNENKNLNNNQLYNFQPNQNPNQIMNTPFNFQNGPYNNNFNPANFNYNNNNNPNFYNNNFNYNFMNPMIPPPSQNIYGFYNPNNNFINWPYQPNNYPNNLMMQKQQQNTPNYFLRKGNGILINDEISNFITKICKKSIDNCIKSNDPKIKQIQAEYIIKYLKELIKGEWFVFICESSLDNFDFKFTHIKDDNILIFSYKNYEIYICLLYISLNISMNLNTSINFNLEDNFNKDEIKENNKDKENKNNIDNNDNMTNSRAKINNREKNNINNENMINSKAKINNIEKNNFNNDNMINSRPKICIKENVNNNMINSKAKINSKENINKDKNINNNKNINNDNNINNINNINYNIMVNSKAKINIKENINNYKEVKEDNKNNNNKRNNDKIIYDNLKKNIESDLDGNDINNNKTYHRVATIANPIVNIQNKIENNIKNEPQKNNNIIINNKIEKKEKEEKKVINNNNKNNIQNNINNKNNIQNNINNNNVINEKKQNLEINNNINKENKEKKDINEKNEENNNNNNNIQRNVRRNNHNFINIRQYYKNKIKNNINNNKVDNSINQKDNNNNKDIKEKINEKNNNNNNIILNNNRSKNQKLNEVENKNEDIPDDVIEFSKINFFRNNIPVNNPDLEQDKRLYNELQRKVKRILSTTRLPQFNFDNYTIQKSIGEGTYGQLYFVINKTSKKKYAVKEQIAQNFNSLSDYLKTFEINIKNKHENILDVYGISVVISEENLFFLYALMDLGECDWEQEVEKRKNSQRYYTEMELISILKQLVSALAFLQKRNIAHRDIKLENILLFPKKVQNSRIPEKIYKICDFGEAKKRIKYNTIHNTVRGTDYYMSPELLEGLNNQKDYVKNNPHKSDVFSLGCCMIIAATLDYEFIDYIRNTNKQEEINEVIKSSLINYYSEKLINIMSKMVVYDEKQRIDFIDLERLINKEFVQ